MEVKLCVAKEARRKSNIEVLEIKYGGIEMTLKEIFEAGGGILFVVLTLVQVAPIKVNPWTALGRSIGRVLNKEVMDKIEEGNAKNARYRIIRFNDEVKHDVKHTEEHFDRLLKILILMKIIVAIILTFQMEKQFIRFRISGRFMINVVTNILFCKHWRRQVK